MLITATHAAAAAPFGTTAMSAIANVTHSRGRSAGHSVRIATS
ncbi:hypothetical protein ACFXDH_53520 [Streptomyces sp. NPDC059467]